MKTRTTETEVYVVSAQKNLVEERMRICKELWDADVKVQCTCWKVEVISHIFLVFEQLRI